VAAALLKDGQLSANKQALYAVSAQSATVKYATFFNKSSTQQTVVVYIRRVGNPSRIWHRSVLDQNQKFEFCGSLELQNGDAIEGETTSLNAIDFIISGTEDVQVGV
jgi:hypothetical protein